MLEEKDVKIRPFEKGDIFAIIEWKRRKNIPPFVGGSHVSPISDPLYLFDAPWIKNYVVEDKTGKIVGVIRQDMVQILDKHLFFYLDFIDQSDACVKAVRIFSKHLLNEQGFEHIHTNVLETDAAIKNILEKSGYKLETTLKDHVYFGGDYNDLLVYGLLKGHI